MRLRHRVALGLGLAALGFLVPSNQWYLALAGAVVVALRRPPRWTLVVPPVVRGQPTVNGDALVLQHGGVVGPSKDLCGASAGSYLTDTRGNLYRSARRASRSGSRISKRRPSDRM